MTPILRPLNLICCCILLLFATAAHADTLHIRQPQLNGTHILLHPYLKIWEDPGRQSDTTNIFQRSFSFQPIDSLRPQSRTSYYWLSADLINETAITQSLTLAFSSLTFVDVYLY
ncbi:MAG: hypothetical protein J7578_16580, partial [Chitinophagaceae bacterium]|nr:hypothetical protein [Chitinophagaceae bacterium]